MRKILIIIVIILVAAFGYASLVKGVQIGGMHISSIMQIDEGSKELEAKIQELNSLIDVEYPKKVKELEDASKQMQVAEDKYLNETNLSTDEELQSALQIENYDIERLWAKVGIHANNEGVNLKLVLNASASGSNETKDLAFTVDGTYIGITNFVYDIEDDEELNFRIYNFKMLPYQNEILRATFTVKDIRITQNSLNEALNNGQQNTAKDNETEENANTVAE